MKSVNPFTREVIADFPEHTEHDINRIIELSHNAFLNWRNATGEERSGFMLQLAELLKKEKQQLATLITSEMGKIFSESEAEIEKCAYLCEYYATESAKLLEETGMPSDGTVSYVRYDPIGPVYAIMPWNFPFWQVLRFAVPTLMAGNTVVLKHAPNVTGCALAIERLVRQSGFPNHVFQTLIIPVELSERVIAHPLIQGVTLTGSRKAGSMVASQAGKYLKKTVLELGGSDPYIVFADADINSACTAGTRSRMMNSGQVCISAKRFLVENKIVEEFTTKQKTILESLITGDPMDKNTTLAPMARPDLVDTIDRQVQESITLGANLVTGGHRIANSNFYAPTLLTGVKKGMPVYDQETFGPVSVIIPFSSAEEAVSIANDTDFGLGASIWTKDHELADYMASIIETGSVFINGMTKSDPRLPFGGTKRSGYGRELSVFGIREFVNIKTVWMK